MFFAPDSKKRKIRLLNEAENELLDAEAQLENAKGVVTAYRARVQRLRAEVCQPAPTKITESVTVGDITQGSISYAGATPSDDQIKGHGTIPLNRHFRRNS